MPDCMVGRFDFILTSQGPKLREFNAHTPYLIYESHYINGIIANHFGIEDPNNGSESILAETILNTIQQCGRGGRVVIVGHIAPEDAITAGYVCKTLQDRQNCQIEYSSIHELTVQEDGLYYRKSKIAVMYSFYPLEFFSLDVGGTQLFRLDAGQGFLKE